VSRRRRSAGRLNPARAYASHASIPWSPHPRRRKWAGGRGPNREIVRPAPVWRVARQGSIDSKSKPSHVNCAHVRSRPNPKHFAALPIRVTSRAGGKKWSLGIHHSAACMSVYCGLQAQSELCAPDHQPGFSCGNRETMRTRYALQRVQQQAEWVHTRQPLPPLVSLYRGGSCSGRDDACRRSVSRPSCAHTTTARAREPIDRSS
jgi:hypothetical protein